MNTLLNGNLISTKDASALSGYNADYLSRLCRAGKIRGEQVGRAWLIERSSLEEFMATQVMRKIELSENLAREREEEYRRINQAVPEMTVRMQDKTDHAVNTVMSVLSKMHMPQAYPAFGGRAASFALTALVIGGSTLIAGSGIVEKTGVAFTHFAFETRELALESADRTLAYAHERNALLASRAMQEVRVHDLLLASVNDARVETLPSKFSAGFEALATPREIPAIALSEATPLTDEGARRVAQARAIAMDLETDPIGSLTRSYLSTGAYLVHQTDAVLAMHLDATYAAADSILSLGAGIRDASSLAVGAYQDGVYAYVRNVELVPRTVLSVAYGIGDAMATGVSGGVQRAPERYDAGIMAFAMLSQDAGERIARDSSAFGDASRTVVTAMLEMEDRSIAHAVGSSRVAFGEGLDAVESVPPSIAYAFGGGVDHLTAAVASAQALTASPFAAFEPSDLLEGFTHGVLTFFSDAVTTIAGFFGGEETGLAVIPSEGPEETYSVPTAVQQEGGDTNIYEGPVTIVNNHNEYPALTYSGVTKGYVDTQLTLLNDRLIRSIDNSRRAARGGTISINGLSGTGLTLSNSAWNGGSIVGATLDVLDTAVTGDLTASGSIESSTYIAGPYVLATSTTATSAFSGNIAAGRNATFGTTAADLLTVNSSIASHLVPSANNAYDLGSAGNYWRRGYVNELIVNNLSAASSSIGGTASNVFSVNSDNATNDIEDSSILFNRGVATPNALMTWNASMKRFEFNMPVYSADGIFASATTTNLIATNLSLGGSQFTSLLGSGLQNVAGALTVSTTTLAGSFFSQDGNSFGSTATLGTNDGQTLQFETGNVPRISVLANGNVGIGTTTPPNKFSVVSGGNDDGISWYNSVDGRLLGRFGQEAGTQGRMTLWNGASPAINLQAGSNSNFINGNLMLGSNNVAASRLAVNGSAAVGSGYQLLAAPTNGLLVEGNVGIGTSSPSYVFDVQGSGSNQARISSTGTLYNILDLSAYGTGGNVQNMLRFNNGASTAWSFGVNQANGNALTFSSASLLTSAPRMVLTTGGNVGIGTTSPAVPLDVVGAIRSNASGGTTYALIGASGNGLAGRITLGRRSDGVTTSAFYGTTVDGANDGATIHYSGGSQAAIELSSGTISFRTNTIGTERMRLDTNGNLGIGTSSPSQPLTVAGNGYLTGGLGIGAANTTAGSVLATGNYITTGTGSYFGATTNFNAFIPFDNGGRTGINAGGSFYVNLDSNNDQTDRAFIIARDSSALSSGTELFRIQENGNVGIGTTTPDQKLSVTGTIKAERAGGLKGSAFLFPAVGSSNSWYEGLGFNAYFDGSNWVTEGDGANNGGSLLTSSTAGGFSFFSMPSTGGAAQTIANASLANYQRMTITSTGNVGIGTSSPATNFHVSGIGTQTFRLENQGLGNLSIQATGGDGRLYTSSGPLLLQPSTGNVGIGTTSPVSQFTIDGTNSAAFLTYGDTGTGSGTFTLNSPNFSTLSLNGNTDGAHATANSTIRLTLNNANYSEIGLDSAYGNGLKLFTGETSGYGGGSGILITQSGNVGIGTTNPGSTLDVSAGASGSVNQIRATFGTGNGNSQFVANRQATSNTAAITFQTNGTTDWAIGQPYSSLGGTGSDFHIYEAGASSRLTILKSTGYVGIGTTTPNYLLSLGIQSAANVNQGISLARIAGGQEAVRYGIRSDAAGNYRGSITMTNAAGTQVETMTFSPVGNVGIGTSSPSSILHIESSSPVITVYDTAGSSGARFNVNGLVAAGSLAYRFQTDSGTNTIMSMLRNGNVGIGTSSPTGRLTVYQSAFTSTDGIYLDNSGNNSGRIYIDSGGALNLQRGTNTGQLVLSAAGNVGIGTTSPVAKLDVGGQIGTVGSGIGAGAGVATFSTNVNNSAGIEMRNASAAGGASFRFAISDNNANDYLAFEQSSTGNGGTLFGMTRSGISTLFTNGTGNRTLAVGTVNAGAVVLGTSNAERLRITSTGNVGIGTSSPQNTLELYAGNPALRTTLSGTSGAAEWIAYESGTYKGGFSAFGSTYPTTSWRDAVMLTAATDNTGSLIFRTRTAGSYAERMNITNAGNVGIGTTTPTAQLHTTGTVRFSNFGAGTLQTDADGNLSVSSDERLKQISGGFGRGLADLMGINPITFHWKASTGFDTVNSYAGFSAQNVQSAIPEAVDTDPRGYLTLSDRPILAASVNAIKELNLRTLSLAPAETNTAAKNLEVSADASIAGALSVFGSGSFALGLEATDVRASRVLVPKTGELPAEVLTGGDADLFKMAARGMADGAEALRRTDLVMEKLATIDQRLAELEAAASAPAGIPVIENLSEIMSRFSIRDGILSAVEMAVERLTIGSPEKPTGVTFYDEVTGEPYCLAIRNGAQVIREGKCEVASRTAPEPAVVVDAPAPQETVSTSTPPSPAAEMPSPSAGAGADDGAPEPPAEVVETPAEPAPEPIVTPAAEPAPSPEPAA